MDNEKRITKLKEKDYQKYFGVTKETFETMYKILDELYSYPILEQNAKAVGKHSE